MVNKVEADFAVEPAAHEVGSQLPQVVMDLHSPRRLLPKQCPSREIKINKLDPWERVAGEGSVDSLARIVLRKHPDVIEPRCLLYTVPAHAGLGTSTGFTAIGRNEDFHIFVMHLSRWMDRIRKRSIRTPISA
jgi:hypothetical protein